jgi:hypothetical protein
LKNGSGEVTSYHMAYALTRTSMALDQFTLGVLDLLSQKWGVPKAEVMRRAVRKLKEAEEMKENCPKPLEALDWLQNGGGMTVQDADAFREEVRAEREAKRNWWEA